LLIVKKIEHLVKQNDASVEEVAWNAEEHRIESSGREECAASKLEILPTQCIVCGASFSASASPFPSSTLLSSHLGCSVTVKSFLAENDLVFPSFVDLVDGCVCNGCLALLTESAQLAASLESSFRKIRKVHRSFYESIGDQESNTGSLSERREAVVSKSARAKVIPDSPDGDAFDDVRVSELSPLDPLLLDSGKATGSPEQDGQKLVLRTPLRHGNLGTFALVLLLCFRLPVWQTSWFLSPGTSYV
jgi:hypothetical protein